ncbi:uncharacterized protein LOC104582051 [Brachypodium distachyon]|uniref:uncharacterized protein LOC104582051 n=1 Tax=Brachypodium distachyon TaxID=15368 RepID=UPI00052FFC03|nr:uncharacterized protein LOC104582051 [Brachypodium distachyon]|eukprot:XP_010229638.1 uncharacterized protein LOC104582051 [Brachypodium distachyon]
MALVQKYGKPDIFLTMTCNPNWEEIVNELFPGQTPQDRPDLVVRLTVPEQYDRLISAELPDKHKYPELYAMVVKHMMHGPCGVLKPNNTLDNIWVVPYNPYLLRMFNCHINVEVCSSIKAVKYIYKYIYKGGDQTSMNFEQPDSEGNIDEIKRYIDARRVTPPEALWRIFGFNLYDNSPSVLQLPLHLPGMHMVSFNAKEDLRDVAAWEKASKSMLTEYFEANKTYECARTILYKDFPEWFTWQEISIGRKGNNDPK